MSGIDQLQQELVEEFAELADGFERYAYLIELAALLPPYPEELRTEDRLVRGCQSHVWLDITVKEGRFYVRADSNTQIIKGVLLLLCDLLNGQPREDVAATELDFMGRAGLDGLFSDERQKGIGSVIAKLRDAAR